MKQINSQVILFVIGGDDQLASWMFFCDSQLRKDFDAPCHTSCPPMELLVVETVGIAALVLVLVVFSILLQMPKNDILLCH